MFSFIAIFIYLAKIKLDCSNTNTDISVLSQARADSPNTTFQ
jgi:hypothetical protein